MRKRLSAVAVLLLSLAAGASGATYREPSASSVARSLRTWIAGYAAFVDSGHGGSSRVESVVCADFHLTGVSYVCKVIVRPGILPALVDVEFDPSTGRITWAFAEQGASTGTG